MVWTYTTYGGFANADKNCQCKGDNNDEKRKAGDALQTIISAYIY